MGSVFEESEKQSTLCIGCCCVGPARGVAARFICERVFASVSPNVLRRKKLRAFKCGRLAPQIALTTLEANPLTLFRVAKWRYGELRAAFNPHTPTLCAPAICSARAPLSLPLFSPRAKPVKELVWVLRRNDLFSPPAPARQHERLNQRETRRTDAASKRRGIRV
jgi:hypothetical protein